MKIISNKKTRSTGEKSQDLKNANLNTSVIPGLRILRSGDLIQEPPLILNVI